MVVMKRLAWIITLSAVAVGGLVCLFKPNGDLAAFIQHPATIGWAQAIANVVAVAVALHIATTTRRDVAKTEQKKARARRAAIFAVTDLAIDALTEMSSKVKKKSFTTGNVTASYELAEGIANSLASIPLMELTREEAQTVSVVARHMITARRRVGFIRDNLKNGKPSPGIGFSNLLDQVKNQVEVLKLS
ncbi:MAG: hypothetical protein EON59_16600 [Alphaproteobacteria bacterium]|nr:MAG: hypothetical protein EON59_16600 [Alphaproteobacteria bacterium]